MSDCDPKQRPPAGYVLVQHAPHPNGEGQYSPALDYTPITTREQAVLACEQHLAHVARQWISSNEALRERIAELEQDLASATGDLERARAQIDKPYIDPVIDAILHAAVYGRRLEQHESRTLSRWRGRAVAASMQAAAADGTVRALLRDLEALVRFVDTQTTVQWRDAHVKRMPIGMPQLERDEYEALARRVGEARRAIGPDVTVTVELRPYTREEIFEAQASARRLDPVRAMAERKAAR